MVAADVGGAIKGEIRADFLGIWEKKLLNMQEEWKKKEKCIF